MEQRCLCTGVGSIWSNAVCVLGWLVIITGSQKVAKNTEQRCLCTGVGSICGLKSVPEIGLGLELGLGTLSVYCGGVDMRTEKRARDCFVQDG